jgi:hypothetical protein
MPTKHIKLTPEVITNLVPASLSHYLFAVSFVTPIARFREGQQLAYDPARDCLAESAPFAAPQREMRAAQVEYQTK